MRITALIAVAAVLALSLGGLVHNHEKACCGAAMPMDAGVHGVGPCLGLCTTAVSAAASTAGLVTVGWFVAPPLLRTLPVLADPIEKPPA